MQLALPSRGIRFASVFLVGFFLSNTVVAQLAPTTQSQDSSIPQSPIRIPAGRTDSSQSSGIDLNSGSTGGLGQLGSQGRQSSPNLNSAGQTNTLGDAENRRPLTEPLPVPTEFQKVVRDTLGRSLPIYGANLFRNTPSTFAPVDRIPVTPDYTIGPGDEVQIQSWGQVTLNSSFVVDRTGSIYVPQVGTIHISGLHYAQLQDYLKSQMGRIFRNFDLNVNMGQLRSIQLFVVGKARRPGSYTVSSLSTLVNALFVTGGPAPEGSMRHIQLKRDGKVVTDFDLYDLLLHGDKSKDSQLLPGDVLYIPSVGPQVAVAGGVNTPSIYELKQGETVADAVQLAGGLTSVTMTQKLRIERISEQRNRAVLEFAWTDEGRATLLRNGDILEFPIISDQFKDAVTLRGNVANPGRYTWHPGMRIRDLIPNRESLITQDYWQQRAKLGESTLTYTPLLTDAERQERARQAQIRASRGQNISDPSASLLSLEEQTLSEGQYSQSGQIDQETQPSQARSDTLNRSSNANQLNSQPGQGSTAMSEFGDPSSLFKAKTYVVASGPDINWTYAVIDRQDKKTMLTSLIPFNLGALVLQGDEAQNYELQPEDVVSIFSQADIRVPQSQQTRYVRLEGEFVGAGVYTVHPGETLRQLVKRAGGLTQDAYLYGSDFSRESTRRSQQQRLNDYANQLERQASSATVKAGGNAASAQDASAAAIAQQQATQLVARLRQLQATGRIVLTLPVDSQGADALPDLPLEDGDRFLVPRVPSTVGVEGAVYNANAFLYTPGQRVGNYVKLAGGSNRDADVKRAFVIRADGAVVSRQYTSALRGGSFDSLKIYPGDTVVVPQNLNRGALMRNLVDIATIVGQFGLAAAAINLVR